MELFKKRRNLNLFIKCGISFLLGITPHFSVYTEPLSLAHQEGRILFLAQQGEHEQALKLYQTSCAEEPDFELLHQIALKILSCGFQQKDPEAQLLALFGASISAHEDAYYILEESTKSRFPQIQLIAVSALSQLQNDRADRALISLLGSPSLEVRYEVIRHLCKKKHVLAVSQAESLMHKTPSSILSLYPPLFASVGDAHAMRILRKLLHHASTKVRLSVILSLIKYQRDDFLPQIRQQLTKQHYALQEASAYAIGTLKDSASIPQLERLTSSSYPTVKLAAHVALCDLGHSEKHLKFIVELAKKEDLYAISALKNFPEQSEVLLPFLKHPNLNVRFNALITLLHHHHPAAFELAPEVLIHDQRDLAFNTEYSPGQAFEIWKVTPSANQILKDDVKAYAEHISLQESVLKTIQEASPSQFISVAHRIFSSQQRHLIPETVQLLEDLQTEEAVACLKEHHQQLGSPFVRHCCNLGLYRLQEPGPYGDQLQKWIKSQMKTEFIRFKPFTPWEIEKNGYQITPEETSRLLIESFEAFASQRDKKGIETLIDAIATGHDKNKYALAGLLLRATQ